MTRPASDLQYCWPCSTAAAVQQHTRTLDAKHQSNVGCCPLCNVHANCWLWCLLLPSWQGPHIQAPASWSNPHTVVALQGCKNVDGVSYGDKCQRVLLAGELLQAEPHPQGVCSTGPAATAKARKPYTTKSKETLRDHPQGTSCTSASTSAVQDHLHDFHLHSFLCHVLVQIDRQVHAIIMPLIRAACFPCAPYTLQDGSWDEISGEAFLRKLLAMPIEEAKYNTVRPRQQQRWQHSSQLPGRRTCSSATA